MALVIGGKDSESYFKLLEQNRQKIEQEIGENLDWKPRPAGKENVISVFKTDADPLDKDDRRDQIAWIADRLERFDSTFRPIIKDLDPSD